MIEQNYHHNPELIIVYYSERERDVICYYTLITHLTHCNWFQWLQNTKGSAPWMHIKNQSAEG